MFRNESEVQPSVKQYVRRKQYSKIKTYDWENSESFGFSSIIFRTSSGGFKPNDSALFHLSSREIPGYKYQL